MLKRLICALCAVVAGIPAYAQFSDVPPGHPAEGAVLRLTQLGVLTGFPDGYYRGQRPVDRYELALILSRMWDTWSTAQLGDVWSEIVGLETQVAELQESREEIRRNQAVLAGLEAELARAQERLLALDDRTANFRLTREDVSELEVRLGELTGALQTLRRRVQQGDRVRGEETQGVTTRFQEAAQALRGLERRLTDLDGRFGEVQAQLGTLRTDLEGLPCDVDAQLSDLRDEFITVRDARAWSGDLTVAAGLMGEGAAYGLETRFTTQRGSLHADLNEGGLRAEARGRVLEGFDLAGHYQTTDHGTVGLASAELAATPALRLGVTGSSDQGLAFGGYLRHLGDQSGAALPGLDVLVGVSAGQTDAGDFGRLLVQGSAGLSLDGGSYVVRPAVLYRRETGLQSLQGFVGELGIGLDVNADLTVSALGRYGYFTDLAGGPGRGTPEGALRLDFTSGLNLEVEATTGLPDGEGLGTFTDANVLITDFLEVGVRVGYTVSLEELP
jgi:hypothetical protein